MPALASAFLRDRARLDRRADESRLGARCRAGARMLCRRQASAGQLSRNRARRRCLRRAARPFARRRCVATFPGSVQAPANPKKTLRWPRGRTRQSLRMRSRAAIRAFLTGLLVGAQSARARKRGRWTSGASTNAAAVSDTWPSIGELSRTTAILCDREHARAGAHQAD